MLALKRPLAVVAFVTALTATSAHAGDHVVLKNHQVVHGKVVSSTADSVTFDHEVGGKSVEVLTYSVDELEPVSFYLVRHEAVAGDAKAMTELGRFCLSHDMSARARDLFEAAGSLDPANTKELGELRTHSREASAAQILAEAKTYQAEGKPDHAWRSLQECVRHFGDTPSGQKAKDLVDGFFQAYQARYVVTQSKQNATEGQRHMKEASKLIDRAQKRAAEALADKNTSTGLRAYKEAVREYEHAVEELDRIAKDNPDDADVQGSVAAARETAVDGAVQAHLNAAGIYMVRTAYQDAEAEANKALAIDPDNTSAKSMRTRIATSASLNRW